MKYIGLLDCNNFFVSCERLFRPDLKNVPTMVLSSNDGCVVARSQEIKDMGVPMGVPYFKIKDFIKDKETALFSSNFRLYRDISSRVFACVRQQFQAVKQYSVDEAFFEIEASDLKVLKTRLVSAREVIMKEVGIPVSIGVASTKTQAKYANQLAKKQAGVQVLGSSDFAAEAPHIPLSKVWGVGQARYQQFKNQGLRTVEDFLAVDGARIDRLFGIEGKRLRAELSGEKVQGNVRDEGQKSLMSTRSFKSASSDLAVLLDAVAYHVSSVAEELREKGLVTNNLRVLIRPSRHGDYVLRGGSKEVLLPQFTNDTFTLLAEANRLTKELFEAGVPYKKVGVVLSNLSPEAVLQAGLFQETIAHNPLFDTVDEINSKLGRGSIKLGVQKKDQLWQASREMVSPAYTTKWDEIATVRA